MQASILRDGPDSSLNIDIVYMVRNDLLLVLLVRGTLCLTQQSTHANLLHSGTESWCPIFSY